MKRIPVIFILILSLSCTIVFEEEKNDNTVSGSTFWVRRADNKTVFYKITKLLLYSGAHCEIYADINYASSLSAQAKSIADEFDNNIYFKIRNVFGNESDMDGNGKVTIVLLDIIDGSSGPSYVAGFFDPIHLFSKSSYSYSNEKDMIFMDCVQGTAGTDDFNMTIAHEFQHLINFKKNNIDEGSQQETWLNEGLSSAAETIYLDDIVGFKVDYFNDDEAVRDGTYFLNWTDEETKVMAHYATVYLFFQWLRIQASNSNGIFTEIMNYTGNNFQDVLTAAQTRIYNDSGKNWNDLFSDWLIANYFCHASNIYGYKGLISTVPQDYSASGAVSLNPGGAVYKNLNSSFSASTAGNISYIGINKSSYTINKTGTFTSDEYLIAYNKNSSIGDLPETSTSLPASSLLPTLNASKASSNVSGKQFSFPVDIPIRLDKK